jgi:hypothetical protein
VQQAAAARGLRQRGAQRIRGGHALQDEGPALADQRAAQGLERRRVAIQEAGGFVQHAHAQRLQPRYPGT